MPVWNGNWLWIWQVDKVGDTSHIINKARDMNIAGVLVKAHDGSLKGTISQGYMKQFKEVITPLKKAGLGVGAWGYVYGINPGGEVEAVREAIQAGADWYVIDAEVEFEPGKRTKEENERIAREICEGLNKSHPNTPKGFTSFAIPQYHPLPYHVFAEYVDVMMPQIYWHAIGWGLQKTFDSSYTQWQKFGLPLAPVGQAYGDSPPEEMKTFADLAIKEGSTGISWWDWQHASSEQLKAIKLISNKFTGGNDDMGKFNDLEGHWAKDIIERAYELGLVSGRTKDTFAPNENLTRAEGVVLIMRLYDLIMSEKKQ